MEVLVVHRPEYDDWSLPKGKVDRGESLRSAAAREVLEETGFSCTLGPMLATVTYRDAHGRNKAVVYWAMVVDHGSFRSNDEVDVVKWLGFEEAQEALDHDRDVRMLRDSMPQILSGS